MPAIAGSSRLSSATSRLLKVLLCGTSLSTDDNQEGSQQESVQDEGPSTASRTASAQFPSTQQALDVLKAWKTGHPELVITSPCTLLPESSSQLIESPEDSSPIAHRHFAPERSQLSRAWSASTAASPPAVLSLARAASAAASSTSSGSDTTHLTHQPPQHLPLQQQQQQSVTEHSSSGGGSISGITFIPTISVAVPNLPTVLPADTATPAPTLPVRSSTVFDLPAFEEQRWSFRDVEQAMGVELSFSLPSGANIQAWARAGGPRNVWDTTVDGEDGTLMATYWREADRVLADRHPPCIAPPTQGEDTIHLPDHHVCSAGSGSLYEFDLGDMCDIDAGHTAGGDSHTSSLAPAPASGGSLTGSYHPITCLTLAEMPDRQNSRGSHTSSSPFSTAAAAPGPDVEYQQPGYTFPPAAPAADHPTAGGTGNTPRGTASGSLPRIPSCSLSRAHSACRSCVMDACWPSDMEHDSNYHQGSCVLSGDETELSAPPSVHQLSAYRLSLSAPLPALHRPLCFRCSPRCSVRGCCQGNTIMSAV